MMTAANANPAPRPKNGSQAWADSLLAQFMSWWHDEVKGFKAEDMAAYLRSFDQNPWYWQRIRAAIVRWPDKTESAFMRDVIDNLYEE